MKKLYDPIRIKPVAGFTDFVKEAADVVGNLIGKWFSSSKIDELAELARGEAKVLKYNGHSIALYKDENGKLYAVNPACTHINCKVAWNSAEESWIALAMARDSMRMGKCLRRRHEKILKRSI